MKALQLPDMAAIQGPGFTAVEQCRDTDGFIDCYLGVDAEVIVHIHPLTQSSKGG